MVYPHLLPSSAIEGAFHALPMNVWAITEDKLIHAGVSDGTQWLVVAGWDCSDLSPAGPCTGVNGSRSDTFYPCVRILQDMQRIQAHKPPAYVLENVCT
jgi:site-specific DNA-cytosine methylase